VSIEKKFGQLFSKALKRSEKVISEMYPSLSKKRIKEEAFNSLISIIRGE
jgi:hypothetical protein